MAAPYTAQTISGYNSSAPSDDGSIVASNEVAWQKHLDKIGDPVKTLSEAINTELLAAFGLIFGQDISVHSTNYTVLAADQGKFLSVTGTTTITLLAAATAGASFPLAIINNGTGVVTVDGSGAETINGSATITLNPGNSLVLTCNATLWIGHIGLGDQSIKTVGVASAVNEVTVTNAATGSGPDISATGDDTNIDINLTPKGDGSVVIATTSKTTISGAAASTITVSGLDSTYTDGYIVDGIIIGDTNGTLDLIINADSTATNYHKCLATLAGTYAFTSANDNVLNTVAASPRTYPFSFTIIQDATTGAAEVTGSISESEVLDRIYQFSVKYTVTDNITSIGFDAGAAAIGIGSFMRVRRIV